MSIQKMGNRLAIILLCNFLAMLEGIEAGMVVGILSAFIVTCIGAYTNKKKIILGIIIGYIICSVCYPVLVLSYPIILYELMEVQREVELCRWSQGVLTLGTLRFLVYCQELSGVLLAGEVLIFGITVWMNSMAYQNEMLQEKFVETRDNGTELAIALENENKILLEKQDSDIYAATLKERNRIAREIHDNVGHMLSRGILMTGALMAVSKDESTKEGLKGLKECLDEAMTNIRQSVHDLHDESIDLEQAVKNLYQEMKDYEVKLDYDMERHIPREIKYSMIAIVKECLSNIIKHSNGNKIRISLLEHPSFYKLAVEDNGSCGSRNMADGGIGLHNIKDRVDGHNGTLNILAEKSGFKVYVSIPKK